MTPSTDPLEWGAMRLLARLRAHGVRICFANPGTTEMWLVAALDHLGYDPDAGGMRPVLCLQEGVAASAADGWARVSRSPAAVLLHLGPGLGNALSQLHNARRAHSPMVCLVGDMATWHAPFDPVLHMDLDSIALTVSNVVARPLPLLAPPTHPVSGDSTLTAQTGLSAPVNTHRDWLDGLDALLSPLALKVPTVGGAEAPVETRVSSVGAQKWSGWQVKYGPADSKVVTLAIPHDCSWNRECLPAILANSSLNTLAELKLGDGPLVGQDITLHARLVEPALMFVRQVASALKGVARGRAALYIGGDALLEEGGALHNAGLVAAAVGAQLFCENAFARVDRGAGRASPRRLPYFPAEALRELASLEMLVVVGTRPPVANFGYEGGPSLMVPKALLDEDKVWEMDGCDVPALLEALAAELGAAGRVQPGANCGGMFPPPSRPPLPPLGKKLSPAGMCAVVAALQPEGCVVVDESLTSGGSYWDLSRGCPPFMHLTLTGGAIGSGPPLALGAALAAPYRRVINLQADGSACYSPQALWSQMREGAAVTTIICANAAYSILKVECAVQRLPRAGPATRALTDLTRPTIDWTTMAQGWGLPACKATTVGELHEALRGALAHPGPYLIEAMLV